MRVLPVSVFLLASVLFEEGLFAAVFRVEFCTDKSFKMEGSVLGVAVAVCSFCAPVWYNSADFS